MELGAVLPITAEVREGHLYIGGVDMVQLAHEQGTALYVFDEADLEDRMRTFRSAFERRYPNSGIIFASKLSHLDNSGTRSRASRGLGYNIFIRGREGRYYVETRTVDGPMAR